jgi:ferredoxin
MPTVTVGDETVACEVDATLREVLRNEGLAPYNGAAAALNCRGLGTCGTCAVAAEGALSEPTRRERWRLDFPPHERGLDAGLRLACQARVRGDVRVRKAAGFWGQHVDE